jgi:hypothetical protein
LGRKHHRYSILDHCINLGPCWPFNIEIEVNSE